MTIYIKHNAKTGEKGRITNEYYGASQHIDTDNWIAVQESEYPTPTLKDTEYPVFYYDEATDEITVEIKTIADTTDSGSA